MIFEIPDFKKNAGLNSVITEVRKNSNPWRDFLTVFTEFESDHWIPIEGNVSEKKFVNNKYE